MKKRRREREKSGRGAGFIVEGGVGSSRAWEGCQGNTTRVLVVVARVFVRQRVSRAGVVRDVGAALVRQAMAMGDEVSGKRGVAVGGVWPPCWM